MERIRSSDNGDFFNEKGERIKVAPIGYPYIQQAFRLTEARLHSKIEESAVRVSKKINGYTKGFATSDGACVYHPIQFFEIFF